MGDEAMSAYQHLRSRRAYGRHLILRTTLVPFVLSSLALLLGAVALAEGRPARGETIHIASGLAVVAVLTPMCIRALRRLRGVSNRRERAAIADAVELERRRVAANVHDLVMQEIALAVAAAKDLLDEPRAAESAREVVVAGERALRGARQVVAEHVGGRREPVGETLSAVVRDAARGRRVRLHVDSTCACCEVDAETLEALLHVAREAVTNAVKHARGRGVEVALRHDDEWQLEVRDDGAGDAGQAAAGSGLGLMSMRAMTAALGGSLKVVSRAGEGTTVLAVLP